MPNIEKHKPGTFCWFELATTDQPAAKQFYTSLFGWTANDFPMGPNEFYTMFQLDGREVGAGYTMRAEQRSQGVPPNWLAYVAVENADDTARKAAELGGQVFAPPFDVMSFGRMSVLADPAGAVFAVWQPKQHPGTSIAGVDGTVCWADLNSPDAEKAKQFYGALFGWQFAASEQDSSGYLHIKNGDEFIGGVPPAQFQNPHAPPHWLIYFLVSDCADSTQKASQLGAQAMVKNQKIEHVGSMSVLKDPQGAVFALFQPERK